MRERILPLDFRFSEATGISDPTRPRSSIFTTNKNILLKRTRKESTSSITRCTGARCMAPSVMKLSYPDRMLTGNVELKAT